MLTASCGPDSTEPHCRNANWYGGMLTLGPVLLGIATLGAVWLRCSGRPRLVWFLPWAPALAGLILWANALAGGKIIGDL